MISKEDFIQGVTSHGHESRLRFMTLEQIRCLRQTKEHGMCVLVTENPSEKVLFGSMNINSGYGYANMLLFNPLYSKNTYFTSGNLKSIYDNEDWNDLEYYIVPAAGTLVNIEELI